MALTEADRTRMGTIAPEMLEALKNSPFPDLTSPNPSAPLGLHVRHNRAAHLAQLRHLYPISSPLPDEIHETDHRIPVRDGTTITARIYKSTTPRASGEARPLILAFHEGGWSMGDLTDEDLNCRLWTRSLGAVCVNVAYRLAPEHPFPTSVNDAYGEFASQAPKTRWSRTREDEWLTSSSLGREADAVKWCAATASPSNAILPADPTGAGFIVSGASAGGNLAAVLCQIARDEHLAPPITGQYLSVPALLWPDVVPAKWQPLYRSRQESTSDPVLQLSESSSASILAALKPDTASPLFSPLLHPDLSNLPPAFFQLGGLDPLRDEGLIYERVLREENGVPTRLKVYDGYGHMFWTNWPLMERSGEFWDDMVGGMRWLVGLSQRMEGE